MKYGDILKKLRNNKGLSQKELTDRLNINRSTYARYETSATQPDFDTLKKIANFYNVTVDYILGNKTNNIEDMSENDIDAEIKEITDKMNVWYKSEPEDKELKLRMLRRMLESFEEE